MSENEKKPFYKKKLVWLVAAIVLIVAVATSGGEESPTSGGEAASNSESRVDEPKTEFSINETATFDSKSVTVTDLQRNYNTGNQFAQPESGKEFVIVTVTITNESDSALDYNTFEFKMQDSNGVQQSESIMALSEGKLNSGSLAPGGRVVGKLAYEVPKDDAGLKLVYESFSFFSKPVTFSLQ